MSDVLFRSSVGGFNKKDVAGFITAQNEKFKEALKDKDLQIEELRKKCDIANSELITYKSEVDRALSDSKADSAVCGEIFIALSALDKKANELCEISKLSGELMDKLALGCMSRIMALREAESYREKAHKYDMLTGLLTNSELASEEKLIKENASENDVSADMLFSGINMMGLSLEEIISRLKELSEGLEADISVINERIKNKRN